MSRIHPAYNKKKCQVGSLKGKPEADGDGDEFLLSPTMLTVWKRSSMSFQGTDGFTVIDQQGRLVFRVDNYSRKSLYVSGGGLVLMDGPGNALLTLKPQSQIPSMQYQWNAYRGEDGCGKSSRRFKVFSMRKRPSSLFFHSSIGKDYEAEVFMGSSGHQITPDFRVHGCFRMRNCNITTPTGQVAAKINRKRINSTVLLADDVFSLVVQPGFDTQLIMAFVVVLDRICSKPFTPVLCS